jgi:hypothetical protein
MNNDFVRNAVEGTLQADMDRFREYALAELASVRATSATEDRP